MLPRGAAWLRDASAASAASGLGCTCCCSGARMGPAARLPTGRCDAEPLRVSVRSCVQDNASTAGRTSLVFASLASVLPLAGIEDLPKSRSPKLLL